MDKGINEVGREGRAVTRVGEGWVESLSAVWRSAAAVNLRIPENWKEMSRSSLAFGVRDPLPRRALHELLIPSTRHPVCSTSRVYPDETSMKENNVSANKGPDSLRRGARGQLARGRDHHSPRDGGM